MIRHVIERFTAGAEQHK